MIYKWYKREKLRFLKLKSFEIIIVTFFLNAIKPIKRKLVFFLTTQNFAMMLKQRKPNQLQRQKMYLHYENMPIQIYWNFYHQKMKIFR